MNHQIFIYFLSKNTMKAMFPCNWRSRKSLTFTKITKLVYIHAYKKNINKASMYHPPMFPIPIKVLLKDARDSNFIS